MEVYMRKPDSSWLYHYLCAKDAGICDQEQSSTERAIICMSTKMLEGRRKLVIVWRYGLDGSEPQTHAQIAKRLKITKQAVQQIEVKAIKELTGKINTPLFQTYCKKLFS
jgi:DNA-directed RNA polymerase sigma subunit (sigma70/sigma32)